MLDHFPSVGEKITRRPEFYTFGFPFNNTPEYPCTVTYINEKNRFYQVEFDFNGRTFSQGYKYPDLDDEILF